MANLNKIYIVLIPCNESHRHTEIYFRDGNKKRGTVEELTNRTSEDMMKVRNLGRKSLEEVLAKLKELGLSLNLSDE